MRTRMRVLAGLGILVAAGVVLTAFGGRLATEDELYSRGMQSYREKSYKPATEAFEELVKRFPQSPKTREAQFLLGESYRRAQRLGRESTWPTAEKAYQVLTESPKEDLWRARAQAGIGRLYFSWNQWQKREQIEKAFGSAITGFEAQVKKTSPLDLRRELVEVYIDTLQAGLQQWGYISPERLKEIEQEREKAKATPPAPPVAGRKGGDRIVAPVPPRPPLPPVLTPEQKEVEKKRLEWYARADQLISKVDSLAAGKDMEARARWTIAQRGDADNYVDQIVEKYSDTEVWDDAVFHAAQRRENRQKYLEAIAYYERLTKRFGEKESQFVRMANQRIEQIRRPVINVSSPFACVPGMIPKISYGWRNQTKAVFTLFRCEPLGNPHFASLLDMARAGRGEQVKTWSRDLENKGDHVPKSAEEDLELSEPGAYLLTAEAGGVKADCLILITRLAVVTKAASDKTMAYVADAVTGEPVPASDLQIAWNWWEPGGQRWADAKGKSDDAGMFTFEHGSNPRAQQFYLLARAEKSYAFASSSRSYWSPIQQGMWFYGFTDRPAYRPDEDVHFKFIVRRYDGNAFQNVPGVQCRVTINDARNNKVYEKVLTTSENGTLNDTMKLAKEPALGQYSLRIRRADNQDNMGQASFRVEEYKLPEYKVEISASKPTYRVGDQIELKVAASYYFGGPVPDADCEVIVRQSEYWHSYHPYREFGWYYEDMWRRDRGGRFPPRRGGAGEIVKHATLKTDANGVATLAVDTPKLPEKPEDRRDYTYSVEARVVDKSRREIRGDKSIRVTLAPFYCYVSPKSHVYFPGDRIEADVVARNANDQPVKTQGMFRVFLATFNEEKEKELRKLGKPYDQKEVYDLKELQSDKLATNAEGKAMAAFTPDQPGYLLLEMTALTEKEEKVIGTAWAFVASKKERYLGYRLSGVQVIPSKDTYNKGETAHVLIVSQFPNAHVWLGIEGDRIYDTQMILVRERSKLIDIPIKDEYSPNVYLTAGLVRDAMVWRHSAEIVVPPADRFVNLAITTAKETYLPGETAQFQIATTDHKGKPVSCELALGVVDASVYYIQPEYAQDIRQFFYGRRRALAIQTRSSFDWIRHRRKGEIEEEQVAEARQQVEREQLRGRGFEMRKAATAEFAANAAAAEPQMAMDRAARRADGLAEGEAKGGGAGAGGLDETTLKEAVVREDFRATAFWQPTLQTDATGKTTVAVKFPDTLTEWTATARAVTPGTAVGTVTHSLQTKKNIIVRLEGPRFFQEKDKLVLSAVVHNYLDQEKSVKVSIQTKGLALSQAPSTVIKVPKNGEQRVDWLVEVQQPGDVKVTVMAQTDEESDAMSKSYVALPHGAEKLIAKSGTVGEPKTSADAGKSPTLTSEATETLILPAARNNLATVLNIDLSPSIAATMLDSLEYLAQYPYGCVEQTMSRFLPAIVTAKTLRDLGVRNAKLEAQLPDMVQKGLDRLYSFQKGDGGWGWWQDESNPWMTSYVVYGLTIAQQAGVGVDKSRLDRGIAFLRNRLVNVEGQHDTMAYALYVLSHHKLTEPKWLDRIWNDRDKLNAYTRALMALTYHHLGDAERAQITLRNLEDLLEEDKTNGTAHWGKTANYWHWSDDGVEATSYALKAYLAIAPNHRLVRPAMKWLVYNRRGNRWKSTRDTAMAVYGLADFVRATQELAPNYKATVFVNGKKVRELVLTKDNALTVDGHITLGDADLASGPNTIRIVREGVGNLYYTAGMYFYTKEEKIQGAGNELFVKRTYTKLALDKDNKEVRTPLDYGAKLNSGDRIEVTLEVEAKNNYEYLVFEDPRASGCEPVDLRSGHAWGGGVCSYMEIRDTKTAFFVTSLQQGTHKITYQLRAEIPGTFNALPSRGYAMYVPDIRGTSDEWRVQIGERAQALFRLFDRAFAFAR